MPEPKPSTPPPAPPAPEVVDINANTVPGGDVPAPPSVRAKDALGLEDEPAAAIRAASEAVKTRQDELSKSVPLSKRGEPPPAKPAAAKPAAKPPAKPPAGKAEDKPGSKPPVKPEPPAPSKVKVGGKEYTPEELEALVAKATQAPQKPEEKPAEPTKPAPPGAELTAEQVAAAEADWVGQRAKAFPVDVKEEELEAMLLGGKDGLAATVSVLQRLGVRAVLEARKSIYPEVGEHINRLQQAVNPLLMQNEQMARTTYERLFFQKYPEYTGPHLDRARQVAELLVQQYPQQTQAMTPEAFIAEVERQTNLMLQDEYRQWNPGAQGTWKDWVRAEQAKRAAPPTAPPAAPSVTPAAPEPAPKPPVKPMGANLPSASLEPRSGFQKSVAASLAD